MIDLSQQERQAIEAVLEKERVRIGAAWARWFYSMAGNNILVEVEFDDIERNNRAMSKSPKIGVNAIIAFIPSAMNLLDDWHKRKFAEWGGPKPEGKMSHGADSGSGDTVAGD